MGNDFDSEEGVVRNMRHADKSGARGYLLLVRLLFAVLLFVFAGAAYYKLVDFSLFQYSTSSFSDGSPVFLFDAINKWLKVFSSTGSFSVALGLMRAVYSNISENTYFLVFLSLANISLLATILLFFYRPLKGIDGKIKKSIALIAVLVLFLFFALVFSLSIFLAASFRSLSFTRVEIDDLYLNMARSINSQDGAVIGGAANIAKALEEQDIRITELKDDVSDEKIFFSFVESRLPDRMSFSESFIMPLLIKNQENILPKINVNIVLFRNGLLAAKDISQEDVSLIIPVLSRELIKQRFPQYESSFSRDNPNLSVLTERNYNEHQIKKQEEIKGELKEFVKEIDQYIAYINGVVASNSSGIARASAAEESLNGDKKKYVDDLQRAYDKYCKGSYGDAKECKDLKKQIASNRQLIADAQQQISRYKADARSANTQALAEKRKASEYLSHIRDVLQSMEDNPVIPEYQAGVFYGGENVVYIKYSGDQKNFDYYLSIGTHEYSHALSVDGDSAWPLTLEEAMTEYVNIASVASLIFSEEDLKKVQIGYVDEILVLDAMFDRFGREKLENLYFADKSEKSLDDLLGGYFTEKNDLNLFKKNLEALFYIPLDDRENRDKSVSLLQNMLKGEESQ